MLVVGVGCFVLVLLWVESVLASVFMEGSIFLCISIDESIGVCWGVSDCTLGWETGGGGGGGGGVVSFGTKGTVVFFLDGEAFSPIQATLICLFLLESVIINLYMYLYCECIYIVTYGTFPVNTTGVISI